MHEPLPPFASVEELETRLMVSLDSAQAAQAQALLENASNLIRGVTGKSWVDDDGALEGSQRHLAILHSVTVEMVKRAATNPEGAVQQTAGPFNVSFGQVAADNLWLTALERKALTGLGRPKLWAQPTTRGPVEMPAGPKARAADAEAVLGE